jgi:hypothetical protein
MLHVVLDTTAYRADPKRHTAAFRALARLASAQELTLHIPEIVRREFISQQREQYARHVQVLLTELRGFAKRLLPDPVARFLEKSKGDLEVVDSELSIFAEQEFHDWAAKLSAVHHPIPDSHGIRVVDAYFRGEPPFREPRRREDFPDAFAWQAILDIAESHAPLYVVSSDKGVGDACQKVTGVEAFTSLDKFVASDAFQTALHGHFASTNLNALLELLPTQTDFISSAIEEPLARDLSGRTVSSDQIPDDNSSAIIDMVGSPTDLDLRVTDAVDHGQGLFVVPFFLRVECLLSYALFKGDLYGLPDGKRETIGLSELNEHYYDAEEYYELDVEGSVSFEVDADALRCSDLSQEGLVDILKAAKIAIDSVTNISVVTKGGGLEC